MFNSNVVKQRIFHLVNMLPLFCYYATTVHYTANSKAPWQHNESAKEVHTICGMKQNFLFYVFITYYYTGIVIILSLSLNWFGYQYVTFFLTVILIVLFRNNIQHDIFSVCNIVLLGHLVFFWLLHFGSSTYFSHWLTYNYLLYDKLKQ